MATVEVIDWNNKKVGTAELSADVFEAPVRKEVLHEVVRWQLAKRRQGTHKAKTRAEVRGSGKKPFKQKGTGNARQGSNQSPLKPGGGVIFGPTPRNYDFALPKKVKKLALKSALSHLYKEGKLVVVKDMTTKEGKTKELAAGLKSLGLSKAVLVDAEVNDMFKRASLNLPKINYMPVEGVNVYDLLKADQLVMTESSIEKLQARCEVK
ncbi:MAG: 50S ribosomal protein L4 [Bdellovibrionaceae bacterium]|nr:50S ribosomal protein L4 [Pseudobdellovibrionaceae bacterium]|tara:strand:+ start:1254 stop:1880 length:627 start_codon:yes stop_codon:yes gene_type:complete